MKLVTFKSHGQERVGALEGDLVVDLGVARELQMPEHAGEASDLPNPFPNTMIDFVQLGQDAEKYVFNLVQQARTLLKSRPTEIERRRLLLNISDIQILPPVPSPHKIICLGLNYVDHAEEAHVPIPEKPILFSKPNTTIIGTDDFVVYPKISSQVDYEIELGVVIGKGGSDIPQSDALAHVGGYTIFNDISARDIQFGDKQWFRGKSFDTFAPTGPCLVLRDQVSDPHRLEMELRVNGEIRQRSNTSNMIFKIHQIVAFVSSVMTLELGDIIATGTPAGVGFYAKPEKRLLRLGDLIEAEIEGLGVLRNRIIAAE